MQKFLVELGRFGSILLFTVLGLLVALIISVGAVAVMNNYGSGFSVTLVLQVAAIVTIIGAVILGGYFTNLVFKTQALEEKIERLATHDLLTGLLNRHTFIERAEHLFNLAVRSEEALSIVIIDIDHFKNINDVHGRTAGDDALAAFAKLLRSTLRKSDLACRYGGEEFALFLPKTNEQQGWVFCERIHQITRQNGVRYNGIEIKPTLSIGVVSFPEERAETAEALLSLADRALYHAKKTGKNRTVNYIEGI